MIGPQGPNGPQGQPGVSGPAFKVATGRITGPAGTGYYAEPVRKQYTWKPWFAWRPVKTITGKRIWWRNIYRSRGYTYSHYWNDNRDYHYADEFDILSQK